MGNVIFDGFSQQLPDIDPSETAEWLDSLDSVIDARGRGRARFLLMKLLERSRQLGVGIPAAVSTPYINSIPPELEPWFPGDEYMERRIRAYIRWNAAVMVTRANTRASGIGGHLATYASSAALYEVGFNHFFRGKDDGQSGDQVYFQGHAAPGIYARAFLEGRLSEEQLDNFRQEVGGRGLSSYPHPRLMPEFWEFPTVSMGLGPIAAIYQARFNRYLLNRRIADTSRSRVWCFVGDGECDEPETLGALSLASREQLDNLIFVVNCNLQRLDGPVRGNGKVIQELEAVFRGAGWNVIKVIWGSKWDELLARDVDGVLLNKMNSTLDGEYQKYSVESGAYIRENFFGPDPRLRAMVEHLSDDELRNLPRGGHDYRKLYAAYKVATEHQGTPTAILAKTIKGWALGPDFEARNATHQIKKMSKKELLAFRDRLYLHDQVPDEALDADTPPYYRPDEGSPEYEYMMERRRAMGGPLPKRVVNPKPMPLPEGGVFDGLKQGSGNREFSTTMAFANLLRGLLREKGMGARVVPIIPDEARTFGMDSLFPEVKIYAPFGQLYEPVDAHLMLSYKEAKEGQILEEGITEAGSMASFIAAGTAYATHRLPMVPFFIFYSMFGFQRVGDLIWLFGDIRGKGFLCGATAGRTTLMGEGLQHADGHSLVLASTVPNVAAYDPAFAYELAVIVEDGMRRMYGPQPEDVFYYLTLYNENYAMPSMPEGAAEGICRGLYRFAPAPEQGRRRATVLFSGTAQEAAREAQRLLADNHDVAAELWSATSYKALREDALSAERWNRLHPTETPRVPYVTDQLSSAEGPVVAVTDFMKMVPDQVARWVPAPFTPLGTDGFGRSDTRANLRRHFETDAAHVVVAVLQALAASDEAKPEEVADAIASYGLDPEALDPRVA
ncbi:MAG TPA: pyruvate dehydrogenase (acetyl-transferring), homodimeric type [Acidimicrobiales bacterium]|jgi:pyruvate dehydrogenase E1 component|nr:pyruvate dehydrogenase (acetyl-transferring), homodimeric type [Acidimicrobiales bacterium]